MSEADQVFVEHLWEFHRALPSQRRQRRDSSQRRLLHGQPARILTAQWHLPIAGGGGAASTAHVAPYFVPAGGQCGYRSAGGRPAFESL
jgi:hypothetical protein